MGPANRLGYGLVGLYRLTLAGLVGGHCRFTPSCSVYAQQAFCQHTFGRALWQVICRLACCHPWHRGGYDPVVPPHGKSSWTKTVTSS